MINNKDITRWKWEAQEFRKKIFEVEHRYIITNATSINDNHTKHTIYQKMIMLIITSRWRSSARSTASSCRRRRADKTAHKQTQHAKP